LAPSITNRIACSGSRPRSTRSASSVRASVAFSVDPSHSPSGILTPSVEIPSATTCVRSAISMPSSIITARRTSSRRRDMRSPSAVRVRSMNIADTDVFDVEKDDCSASAPTGSPTCSNLRVETPASIRSITARVSGSRSAKYSYVATGSSCSSFTVRTRGRLTLTRRPPSVIEPSSWPWRLAVRSGFHLPFGPTTSSTSSSISSCTTPSPTPTLSASRPSLAAPTSSPSASWICGGSGLSIASDVVTTFGTGTFFMAVPPVLSDLVSAPNAHDLSGRGGRTAFKVLRGSGQPLLPSRYREATAAISLDPASRLERLDPLAQLEDQRVIVIAGEREAGVSTSLYWILKQHFDRDALRAPVFLTFD